MKKKRNKIICVALLFIVAIVLEKLNEANQKYSSNSFSWVNIGIKIIYIITYLIVGLDILKKAFRNIKKGEVFDENFLMAIATLGAFGVGEFPEAVAVMLFYQIGELFQSYAVDKSRKSISSLMDIRPDYANLVNENGYEKVKPKKVNIGDIILVKPGEKVPLDGTVIDGESRLDTSSLTGETVPRTVKTGDSILSGTINLNSAIKIKVEKTFKQSTVSKILDLVENATSKKSKQENFITKFAKIYTPVVVIIAVILAILPPIILQQQFTIWIYRALSFLVVSCPCALVISIPLSFFGGIGRASKEGVLIKGSNYLEILANAKIAVFDKTGTLTEGVFEVQRIEPENIDKNELLEVVAYAESYSTHPIAESIKIKYGQTIDNTRIEKIDEISGHGISAKIDNKNVLVGNAKLMQQQNIEFKEIKETGTIIYTAINGEYKGYILISDKIKADSKKAIQELKKNGIVKTVMLTGDKDEVGKAVAKELKIDEVYTELLPTDKVEKVQELIKNKSEKDKLLFVGDGINDAPVLALSDIGVAMGALGSDSAIEAADIVIMNDEPSKLVNAMRISRKTLKIAKQNTYFAIIIKIAVLILSALGLSTMWMAVFADVGVTVLAILNSFRVLYGKN